MSFDKSLNRTDMEECYKSTTKKPPNGFGVRHTLAFMGCLGIAFMYSFRVNLSVAIVAMVNSTEEAGPDNLNFSTACPYPDDYSYNSSSHDKGEFHWDEKTQGLILGAYFYGYVFTSILGGIASERFGGRIVLGLGILVSAVCTIALPAAARLSTTLFFVIRMIIGCASGVILPAIHNLIPKWYPKLERSKYTTLIFSGIHIGTVVTLPISGWLSSSDFMGGWPSIFYIIGFSGALWSLLWFWLIRDEPSKHSSISEEELKYIISGCPQMMDKQSVPWRSVFTSKYVWAISIMHFGNNWGFYTFLTELPTYLDQILHLDITSNGVISAMPYLMAWVTSIVFSLLMDQLLSRKKISILNVRRLSMILGGYGAMLFLVLMIFADCNKLLALSILIISGGFNGFVYSGFFCSHADISPRFAGTLMGITNVPGTITGFGAPAVTGALTNENQTLFAWKMVFLTAAAIYGLTTTIYLSLITTDVQDWDNPSKLKKEKEINAAMKTPALDTESVIVDKKIFYIKNKDNE